MRIDKGLYAALKKTRVPGTFTKTDGSFLWVFLRSLTVERVAKEVADDMASICGLHVYMILEDAPVDSRDPR